MKTLFTRFVTGFATLGLFLSSATAALAANTFKISGIM